LGTGDGVDWANVRGMTMASGKLYFALEDGTLNVVNWSGDPFGQGHPTGSVTTIAGPKMSDGIDWSSNGMFVFGP
jgi:coenzyme F420-reducing hydrogenase beta subunit